MLQILFRLQIKKGSSSNTSLRDNTIIFTVFLTLLLYVIIFYGHLIDYYSIYVALSKFSSKKALLGKLLEFLVNGQIYK